jgi:FAD synthetase
MVVCFVFMRHGNVMIFGTFDTVHDGHRFFADQAKKYGSLFIIIARDNNVRRFKKRLVHGENERLMGVKRAFPFATCLLGSKDDPYAIVEEISPETICLGYDQKSFDSGLKRKFPDIKIVRIGAYKPDICKSSKILP